MSNPYPEGVEEALEARLTSIDSARYRQSTRSVVDRLVEWLVTERGVEAFDDVDVLDCRRWVQHLAQQVRVGEMAASTAHTYYGTARSFFSWCVDDERLSENPMAAHRVEDELPEDQGNRERQAWPNAAREALLKHVDQKAHDALDSDGDAVRAMRDRAIAYLLADTGARGAELFAVSGDDDRNGVRWGDLNIEANSLQVLGKTRKEQGVQVPGPTGERLERWRSVLEPKSDWPVIPTGDATSKYRRVREVLRERGLNEDELEERLDDVDIDEVLREEEIAPPALTTKGARNVMQRLCEEADIEIDGEYMKPHGGRRALGHRLYHEVSAEKAQGALRHKSVETTKEAYEHESPGELAEDVEGVLYGDK